MILFKGKIGKKLAHYTLQGELAHENASCTKQYTFSPSVRNVFTKIPMGRKSRRILVIIRNFCLIRNLIRVGLAGCKLPLGKLNPRHIYLKYLS